MVLVDVALVKVNLVA